MITILCAGSRGDFQPYIALAQELKRLGKEVRIAGGKSFENFINGYGIGASILCLPIIRRLIFIQKCCRQLNHRIIL